ncbi:uncharacterized protein EDB91DRAFT_632361 [Suillus paluster]|uniref:uncharacterized protein n=1 Tax=Suillus paluster TaxID=48578 RepID=UPI001B87DAC9|nr:uncharacterized protein EDB91DRAFT_632361 [Suillus paluster]KAG1733604.1 hypothetical protein EDB91DRAFT_632361 [Suillus paluster]
MSFSTLYKAFKATLAGREAARQRLLATAWEIEEAKRFSTFLQALHDENRNRLKFKDDELKQLGNVFSERGRTEVDNDTNYLQAAYDDECEMLRAIGAQANLMSRHLGSDIRNDMLASTGQSHHQPRFVGTANHGSSSSHEPSDGSATDTDSDDDDQDDGLSLAGHSSPRNLGQLPSCDSQIQSCE